MMSVFNFLMGFLLKIESDPRITSTHIALYITLLLKWQRNNYEIPMKINRTETMDSAKISSSTTYYLSLKHLNDYGYLIYSPSFISKQGCSIHFVELLPSKSEHE